MMQVGRQQVYNQQPTITGASTLNPPGHSAVAAPGQPAAPGATPGRQAGQFIPDAQYLAQAAQAQFQRQQQLDQIKAQHEAGLSAYNESVRRASEDVPQQRQQVSQSANKQGLFYSGQLGKQLGDYETMVARQRADLQNQFSSEEKAREAARTAILQGEPIDTAAAKAEAVQRQIERDSQAASQNALAPTPVPKRRAIPKPKPKPRRRRRKR
jgi:uncharacterized phage infection (PIP) family protein YhgE